MAGHRPRPWPVPRHARRWCPALSSALDVVVEAFAKAGAAHVYRADSQRHLAPPKNSQLLAEQHGRFDAAFGSGNQAALLTALHAAPREEGTFLDQKMVAPA